MNGRDLKFLGSPGYPRPEGGRNPDRDRGCRPRVDRPRKGPRTSVLVWTGSRLSGLPLVRSLLVPLQVDLLSSVLYRIRLVRPAALPAHLWAGVKVAQILRKADSDLLQDAMRAADIPFRTQNKLLALLAPMKRDIVTK